MQKIIHIEGTNLPDTWFQTLYKAVEIGRNFTIDEGSFAGQQRREMDFVILHIKNPGIGELLPKLNPALNIPDPVAEGYLDDYLPYLMTGEEKEGESYTYGQRINKAPFNFVEEITGKNNIMLKDKSLYSNKSLVSEKANWDILEVDYFVNQMEMVIWTYKNKGYRNNQMIMQVGQPSDILLQDPPCLRHIDTRIQDDKLHFYPYFRSWDLWGGVPANLAAIELMKQYMAEEIGVENGEIIASSKGVHLYSYVFELAEMVRGKTSAEFQKEMEDENGTRNTK